MKDFRKSLKGIHSLSRPYGWRILVSVLIGLLRIAASLAFVWASKCLVDIATGVSGRSLDLFVWILLGIVLTRIVSNTAASYWENLCTIKVQNALRHDMFSHMLRSRWVGREEYHSADILNRIQEDIRVIVELVCVRIPDIIITVCQLVAASIFLIALAPGLLGLLVALMLVGLVGSRMFYRTQRRITEKIRQLDSRSQQHIQENLQKRLLVLTLVGINRVLDRFGKIQKDIEKACLSRLNYNSAARFFMGFGFMAGYIAAFLWGIFGIRDGDVTYGMMTAFLQLVGQVQRPIADLSRHIPAFIQALTSEERISEMTGLEEVSYEGGIIFDEAPEIEVKDLEFTYKGGAGPVIKDFSCTFAAGRLSVVSGPTGEGKSTLAKLVMGLLEPQAGSISFRSSRDKTGNASISNFLYVPQGNSLMSGSIRENLLLASPDATEDDMKKALHTAAADFVFELPDALEAECGENGTGLSEGQAQRIAIARALLHKGSVLILDEASSALDPETEETLLERLVSEYRGRKTVIFISHRDKINNYADSIIKIG